MSDKHEQARDLGEQALDAMDQGDEAKADALIEKAKQIDKTALEELVQDLDEGAGDTPPE
jgi:phage shock protein A